MELLYLLLVVLGFDRVAAEHILGALDQALLPVLDLVGMNIKPLGQLRRVRSPFTADSATFALNADE